MGKWSNWKKIAKGDNYFIDDLNYKGPSCYELSIRKWIYFDENKRMYVGETNNEKSRIYKYAHDGSHISHFIEEVLENGYALFYRSQKKKTKADAKKMQDNLLKKFNYPWNTQLNTDEEDD